MAIDVRPASGDDLDKWDDRVDRSPQGLVFHRRGFLETLEAHGSGRLHSLVGYKGQQPVGLLPVFELSRGPFTTAFSPPPRRAIPYLGPVLLQYQNLKQRKFESLNNQFIEGCLAYLDAEISPGFVFVQTGCSYTDIRPFDWNGFDISQRYTYHVDVSSSPESLMSSFSRSMRRSLTAEADVEFSVEQLGPEAIEFVVERLDDRYREQGKQLGVPAEFLRDLYEELGSETVRPYIGTVDGEWATGIVTVESAETIYYYVGGGRPHVDFPINNHVHWRVMQDAHQRGLRWYDLLGANKRNISNYKAKFDPELVAWFQLERGSWHMNAAAGLYKRFL